MADMWKPHLHVLGLPSGWYAEADPFRVFRSDGSLAATEGDLIRVTGVIRGDSSSFCHFGRDLYVTALEVGGHTQ